jgi:hypothetical protein
MQHMENTMTIKQQLAESVGNLRHQAYLVIKDQLENHTDSISADMIEKLKAAIVEYERQYAIIRNY